VPKKNPQRDEQRQECEQSATDHPLEDDASRHSIDVLMRKHGWKIHSRKHGKEPIWEKCGEVLLESEVLKSLPRLEVNNAKDATDAYFAGVFLRESR